MSDERKPKIENLERDTGELTAEESAAVVGGRKRLSPATQSQIDQARQQIDLNKQAADERLEAS